MHNNITLLNYIYNTGAAEPIRRSPDQPAREVSRINLSYPVAPSTKSRKRSLVLIIAD